MERAVIENLLHKVHGCTFANLDTVTTPVEGIRKETKGQRIILFGNTKVNGYEAMVKRRLVEVGKDPRDFVLSEPPWGQRIGESPLYEHRGKIYLQTIVLTEGNPRYFLKVNGVEVAGDELDLPKVRTNQGLPPEREVVVRTYALENITRLALMGENIVSDMTHAILPVSGT